MCDHYWVYDQDYHDYWPINDSGNDEKIQLTIKLGFRCKHCHQTREVICAQQYDRHWLDIQLRFTK